ncbi:hypothetical protein NERG_01379 [Nematocida ausubeli]|uniref:Uncharacterized protein n=1 Tax=Nematocida ausubeli (strain ATCC PRA-371 / ERTm2) TaxID=1913371 RepID=H8ZCD6_NEMA1|nr:hypothetical protein NERG_01379 [Nematocida ausubeli]
MNWQYLVKLLMLQHICAKIALMDIKHIHEKVIKDAHFGNLTINPEGPLSPLRGYLYSKNRLVHNKRLFSPTIETSYTLRSIKHRNIKTSEQWNTYEFLKNPAKDKPYSPKSAGNESQEYIYRYSRSLIWMFPSVSGDLSIETGRNNSFIRALRSIKDKSQINSLLASLLLLSEGISLPVEYSQEDEAVFLRRKNDLYFVLPLRLQENTKDNQASESVFLSEALKLMNFFITNCECDLLKKGGEFSEPISYKDFKTGNFLNSTKFMIQSYIFEFIDSLEATEGFIHAVHKILSEWIEDVHESGNEENMQVAIDLFERCFVSAVSHDNCSRTDYVDALLEIERVVDSDRPIPFSDSAQIPAYRSVPVYIRKSDTFINDERMNFSNCVEVGLLGIFCCFVYDASARIYATEHIPEASSSLKDFFHSHSVPFTYTDFSLHKTWNRVVSDLSALEIAYVKDRNELRSGLINMLVVIAEISGVYERDKEILQEFIEKITEAESITNWDVCRKIRIYAEDLFKLLSRDSSLKVEFFLNEGKRSDGKTDLFGKIFLKYSLGEITKGILLEIKPQHASLSLVSDKSSFPKKMEESLLNIKHIIKAQKTLLGYLIRQYASFILKSANIMQSTDLVHRKTIIRISADKFESIDRLLMKAPIEGIPYKKELVACTLIYAHDQDLSPEHPAVRFTSNILGSVPLMDVATQREFFPSLVYTKAHLSCYPSILIDDSIYLERASESNEISGIFHYIVELNSPEFLVQCLKVSIKLENLSISFSCPIMKKENANEIFSILYGEGSLTHIKKIKNYIFTHSARKNYMNELVSAAWFVYVCEQTPIIWEVVEDAYSNLHSGSFLYNSDKISTVDNFGSVLNVLNIMRKDLTRDPKNAEKFDAIHAEVVRLGIHYNSRNWPRYF